MGRGLIIGAFRLGSSWFGRSCGRSPEHSSSAPACSKRCRMAATFRTSLTASGYRFASMTSHSVALVWSQAGRVRWATKADEFREWLRLREALDSRTFAAELFQGKGIHPGFHRESRCAGATGGHRGAKSAFRGQRRKFTPLFYTACEKVWSGLRESNPSDWLGKPGHYHYAKPATCQRSYRVAASRSRVASGAAGP